METLLVCQQLIFHNSRYQRGHSVMCMLTRKNGKIYIPIRLFKANSIITANIKKNLLGIR